MYVYTRANVNDSINNECDLRGLELLLTCEACLKSLLFRPDLFHSTIFEEFLEVFTVFVELVCDSVFVYQDCLTDVQSNLNPNYSLSI